MAWYTVSHLPCQVTEAARGTFKRIRQKLLSLDTSAGSESVSGRFLQAIPGLFLHLEEFLDVVFLKPMGPSLGPLLFGSLS